MTEPSGFESRGEGTSHVSKRLHLDTTVVGVSSELGRMFLFKDEQRRNKIEKNSAEKEIRRKKPSPFAKRATYFDFAPG